MSMISPESYAMMCKEMSLKELVKDRDRLLRDIRAYERGKGSEEGWSMEPSPDLIYHCNLLYLAKLCEEMAARALGNEDTIGL